jgi:hypothetical protein
MFTGQELTQMIHSHLESPGDRVVFFVDEAKFTGHSHPLTHSRNNCRVCGGGAVHGLRLPAIGGARVRCGGRSPTPCWHHCANTSQANKRDTIDTPTSRPLCLRAEIEDVSEHSLPGRWLLNDACGPGMLRVAIPCDKRSTRERHSRRISLRPDPSVQQ